MTPPKENLRINPPELTACPGTLHRQKNKEKSNDKGGPWTKPAESHSQAPPEISLPTTNATKLFHGDPTNQVHTPYTIRYGPPKAIQSAETTHKPSMARQ
jgi:hypothetical protein